MALAGREFDLVFTDVVMPDMSGIELADRLEELRPNLPVLLATGFSEALAGGSNRFSVVSKPYDVGSLARAISDLLGLHEPAAT